MKHKYLCSEWWFRESTNEWVWEWHLNIPIYIAGSYRYPGKTKFKAFLSYLRWSWQMYRDYFKYRYK